MQRGHLSQVGYSHNLAPGQKLLGGSGIGASSVRVADVGRKELQKAYTGTFSGLTNQRRYVRRNQNLSGQALSWQLNPQFLFQHFLAVGLA